MKKLISILLSACMLFSLCACGASGDSAPAPTEAPSDPVPPVTEPIVDEAESEIREILLLQPDEALEVDGQQLLFTLESAAEGEPGEAVLRWGSAVASLGYAEWCCRSYAALLSDGSLLVYGTLGFPSDWRETVPVLFRGGDVTYYGRVSGGVDSEADITAPDRCRLTSRSNVFGTYGSQISYVLTESGLVAEGSYVRLLNDKKAEDGSFYDGLEEDHPARQLYDEYGRRVLRLKRELTLHTADGSQLLLPDGSVLWPVGYDEVAGQFFVEYGEGQEGWFSYAPSSKGWGFSIEGIDEEEWFETLGYAG